MCRKALRLRNKMNDDIDLENPFSEPFELEITDSLDLHAFAPRDIKSVVETYLKEARKKDLKIVRIIHGKGIGVQRETVRKVLSETEFVKSFKNAPEFASSWGATIVQFK
jgi:dsDNA-specific endonuclease/ATPase MutS2